MKARTRFALDAVLLAAMLATIGSGLVLLLCFHMGGRSWRPEALGLSRLAWQNLHRLGAVAVLAGVALHLAASGAPFVARLRRTLRRQRVAGDARELVLYLAFAVSVVAGFTAWLVVDGAMPLLGPAPLGPLAHERNQWLDVHHLTALVSLYPAVRHVTRRWRALVALGRRAVAGAPARPPRRPDGGPLAAAR